MQRAQIPVLPQTFTEEGFDGNGTFSDLDGLSTSRQTGRTEHRNMASSKVYKLYATTTGNGVATLSIAKAGKITAISFTGSGIAGAALTDAETAEVALNTATQMLTTNDTVTSLGAATMSGNVNAGSCVVNHAIVGIAIPVQAGDRLVLNITQLGSCGNISSRGWEVYVYVS